MAVDPFSIPRYADPTPEELEEMFREPTPGECYERCAHARVCDMWNGLEESSDIDANAAQLGCEGCDLWDE